MIRFNRIALIKNQAKCERSLQASISLEILGNFVLARATIQNLRALLSQNRHCLNQVSPNSALILTRANVLRMAEKKASPCVL